MQRIRSTVIHLQSYGNRSTWKRQWEVAHWIADQLQELQVELQTYELDGTIWPNVIAKIPGDGEESQVIAFIAHFDSISRYSQGKAPGADDNASGVAVILELAQVLKKYRFSHSIWLCLFSNEERGALGSKAFVQRITEGGVEIAAAINLDGIGYNRPKKPFYTDPLTKYGSRRGKFLAMYAMFKSYLSGLLVGENVMTLAGRPFSANLVTAIKESWNGDSGLTFKEVVGMGYG